MAKTTISFEDEVYEALRLKAKEAGQSMSSLVNDALKNFFPELNDFSPETDYLLGSPENAKRLQESIKQLDSANV